MDQRTVSDTQPETVVFHEVKAPNGGKHRVEVRPPREQPTFVLKQINRLSKADIRENMTEAAMRRELSLCSYWGDFPTSTGKEEYRQCMLHSWEVALACGWAVCAKHKAKAGLKLTTVPEDVMPGGGGKNRNRATDRQMPKKKAVNHDKNRVPSRSPTVRSC